MARYNGPVCRLCRREGMKLFLKGERCYTEKCAIEKRNVPPGQHGRSRKAKMVGYAVQLREKQKVKRIYGVLEDQFRGYFEQAERTRDHPGRRLWVAGYSNDVFGYLPSLRVLKEGGYEGGGAMIYYGRPGPFAAPVEDLVHAKVRELMERRRW